MLIILLWCGWFPIREDKLSTQSILLFITMSTIKISVFVYEHGEVTEKTIEKLIGSSLEYAEDLVIDICRERNIGPIARYLFALYCPKLNVWLSLNQRLNELDNNCKSLQLRIRFKPFDLKKLIKLDDSAFNYYYCQVKDVFRNSRIEDTGQLFGLVITDLLIYLLERKISIENALNHIKSFRDFVPIPYKAESKFLRELKGAQILHNLAMANHAASNNDGLGKNQFVKREFIDEIVNYERTLIKDLGYESFTIYKASRLEKANGMPGTNEFLLQIRPFGSIDIFTAQKANQPDWNFFCSIADICFIIVQDHGVEVSRKNGTPVFIAIPDKLILKSLLSLLEGYHRLITGDSICICEYVMPPSIAQFKEIRCHGPISSGDSLSIFLDKGKCNVGNYLIRHDEKRYEYVVDVWVGPGIKSLRIVKRTGKLMVLDQEESIATFSSFDSLKRELKISFGTNECIDLKICIPPLGSNIFSWCTLSCDTVKQEKLETPESIMVRLNFVNYLTRENRLEAVKDKSFRYYLITHQEDKLLCKVPTIEQRVTRFLEQLDSWSSLTSDLITRTRFISIRPPAFIRDYFPSGPLDEFLRRNHSEIKTYELIECAMYLTRALCYLHEIGITHGMIRCRSLLVVERSNRRFQVRLGDPFIHLDENGDRLWIPKEYSSGSESLPLSVDIFACATTLWEIFSLGQRPPGTDVYNLPRPLSCPSPIWQLIHKCWQPDPEQRKHPMEMHRDIRELFLCEYQLRGSGSPSHYAYIEESERKKRSSLTKFLNKLTTNYRVSSEYDYKLEEDDEYSVDYEYDTDLPWVIPVSHLQISTFNGREAILGTGAYGEVLKARYPADSDNFVAIKRINRRAKERNGQRIITDVEREFQIMTRVFHPNIVSIIGIVKDPEIMLVMEFMELGSLAKFLRRLEPNELESIPFQKYAHDIASGMEYLEKMRIVHRDLAARNILMASTDTVKISDFGLAQSLGPGEDVYFVRTPRYLPFKWYAPESIRNDPIFTHKSDVWSFGVTLWEVFSLGAIPDYPVQNKNSIADLIKFLEGGGTLPKPEKGIPKTDKFWTIMANCWKIAAPDRPNFTQLQTEIGLICKEN